MKKILILLSCVITLSSLKTLDDDSFIETVKSRINQYLKNLPDGELYVSLSQPKYIAGDTVALSIRYSQKQKKTYAKQIVYIKLVDNEGVEKWTAQALLKMGRAICY